jgi:hypothetical protein
MTLTGASKRFWLPSGKVMTGIVIPGMRFKSTE